MGASIETTHAFGVTLELDSSVTETLLVLERVLGGDVVAGLGELLEPLAHPLRIRAVAAAEEALDGDRQGHERETEGPGAVTSCPCPEFRGDHVHCVDSMRPRRQPLAVAGRDGSFAFSGFSALGMDFED